jgi:hypothetical protein
MEGTSIAQFPVRLEWSEAPNPKWHTVEFTNEFQPNEDNNAREMRPEVQVPVYTKPSGDEGVSSRKRRKST